MYPIFARNFRVQKNIDFCIIFYYMISIHSNSLLSKSLSTIKKGELWYLRYYLPYLLQEGWAAWPPPRGVVHPCEPGPPVGWRGGPAGPSCRSWGSCGTPAAATQWQTTPVDSTERKHSVSRKKHSCQIRIWPIRIDPDPTVRTGQDLTVKLGYWPIKKTIISAR